MKTMDTSTKMMIRELYSKEQEQVDLILRIRMLKKVRRRRSNAERKNQNDHHAERIYDIHTTYPLHLTTVRTYTLKLPLGTTQRSHDPRII
jgi:DNA polymerase I-like protein with 3'-5' exonuclease and polymerase domains